MKKLIPLFLLAALPCTQGVRAARTLHLDMELTSARTMNETHGGGLIKIYSQILPENIAGAKGNALRLDGYSGYATGPVPAGSNSQQQATFSVWVAPETYPVIKIDEATDEKARIAGTLDDTAKNGWRFAVGTNGKYAFECYAGGWKSTATAFDILPKGEWSHLVAVADANARKLRLYRNGTLVAETNCNSALNNNATTIYVARDPQPVSSGPFPINTFNGLIDDVEVFDTALSEADIKAYIPENPADLSVPVSRYESQLMRPRFHGMPATAWTNECHGMAYSNGRYHLFFQKNANGPYMTRLHIGHISSPDLCNWREEKIAVAPGSAFDIKGCWSGAVVVDDEFTGGKPNLIYTGVDYAKASICHAVPGDDDLRDWTKATMPLIAQRPSGLSDDFRDPYFFRNGDNAYIIVGSSKDGKGVTTLHKLQNGRFTNDGSIFFSAANAGTAGTFWEMPNVTQMPGGKWLFTTTPLGANGGVKAIYYTGSINADGTFRPDSQTPRTVELTAKEGFGLLSPTIFQKDGKTIALGIVPDKLPGDRNYELGWAHLYSLPREWSLDTDGSLIQKPYEGLAAMRSETSFEKNAFSLNGTESLGNVAGRQAEIELTFTPGSGNCGIEFFKSGTKAAKVYYEASTSQVVADFTGINRWVNDGGVYNGVYRMSLPKRPASGEPIKLHLFIDGSVIDLFVNDRYAQSIRVFPTDSDADGISLFATSPSQVNSVRAWTLRANSAGIGGILDDNEGEISESDPNAPVDVYHISGRIVRRAVPAAEATLSLDSGLYIIAGKKILVK